jgi:hypothetical protein
MRTALHSLIGAYKEEDDIRTISIIVEANLVTRAGRQLKVRSKVAVGQLTGALRVHSSSPVAAVQCSVFLIKNNATVRRLQINLRSQSNVDRSLKDKGFEGTTGQLQSSVSARVLELGINIDELDVVILDNFGMERDHDHCV